MFLAQVFGKELNQNTLKRKLGAKFVHLSHKELEKLLFYFPEFLSR